MELPRTAVIRQALSFAGDVVLRIAVTVFGSWLAGVVPVELATQSRRDANALIGHAPNMEPGAVVALAVLFATCAAVIALVGELIRQLGRDGAPLTLPAHVVLGALAASPVGVAFAIGSSPLGPSALLLAICMATALFHATRWALRSLQHSRRHEA